MLLLATVTLLCRSASQALLKHGALYFLYHFLDLEAITELHGQPLEEIATGTGLNKLANGVSVCLHAGEGGRLRPRRES